MDIITPKHLVYMKHYMIWYLTEQSELVIRKKSISFIQQEISPDELLEAPVLSLDEAVGSLAFWSVCGGQKVLIQMKHLLIHITKCNPVNVWICKKVEHFWKFFKNVGTFPGFFFGNFQKIRDNEKLTIHFPPPCNPVNVQKTLTHGFSFFSFGVQ